MRHWAIYTAARGAASLSRLDRRGVVARTPTARRLGIRRRRLDRRPPRLLHRLDRPGAKTQPPPRGQQCLLPHPSLGPRQKPRLPHPCSHRRPTPPRLETPLRLCPRSPGTLRRHPTVSRHLLPRRQLAPCRPNPGPRQTPPSASYPSRTSSSIPSTLASAAPSAKPAELRNMG
jgi:hypothetical protein